MATQTCSIPDCDRPSKARTWCLAHWKKWKRHGDPTAVGLVGRRRTPADERFWSLVSKGDGCWEWRGTREPFGYGRFHAIPGISPVRAHRFAWELANEAPIPAGLFVLHRCDNPPCVRPDHLFLGSARDNVQDCIAKGRARRNTTPRGPNLSAQLVEEIGRRYALGGVNQTSLAKEYGVSRHAIAGAIKRAISTHD